MKPFHLAIHLIYDTSTQPLPSGVRAVVQRARRLLFAADRFEVLLQVSPEATPKCVKIMGQVFVGGLPVSGASVRLRGPLSSIGEATDSSGEFRLRDLPIGYYSLDIHTADRVLSVPALNLDDAQFDWADPNKASNRTGAPKLLEVLQ